MCLVRFRPLLTPLPDNAYQMNKKHTLVPRLSGALGGLYGRFKRDVVPADNVEVRLYVCSFRLCMYMCIYTYPFGIP